MFPTEPFSLVDVVTSYLPAALVGNSFGGGVALRTALAHPDLVSRLVLIGSGVPAWDWTQGLRDHFAREEAAIEESGDLDAATEVNMEFWVAPSTATRCDRSNGSHSSCRRRTRSRN